MTTSPEALISMLRSMWRIRAFEQMAQVLYNEGLAHGMFWGALHSYEGEEAIAVGVCACLNAGDSVLSTHRGHGHALAKGADMGAMMAELLGRETGISRGRGGSMHMFDPRIGLMGGNGIVGAGMPLALGPAFAAQYRGTRAVTVCFFGDGAATQGTFHESLNLASLWKLPVVFVCENNLWAATTPLCESWPVPDIAARAASYGAAAATVDGNDVLAVHAAAAEAADRARAGEGPTLIEAKTYRHCPHCMVIREHRDQAEIAAWKARDPILRFEAYLEREGILTRDQMDAIAAETRREAEQAAWFARESPMPDAATYLEGVWA